MTLGPSRAEELLEHTHVLDCLSCGTCCFSDLPNYIRVTGDDHARMGDLAENHVVFDGTRAFMVMHDGHCGALILDVERRQFVCSIYALRPDTCRELALASSACAGERESKGERPARALVALRNAR